MEMTGKFLGKLISLGKRSHSMKFRMAVLVMFTVSVLVIFLIVNNIYAINVVRNNAYEANAGMLELFMNQVDDGFNAMDIYLIGLQDSADVPVLVYSGSRTDFYTAKTRIASDMTNTIQSYNYIDNLFIYVSEPTECDNGEIVEKQYFDAAKYAMSGSERSDIKKMMTSYIDAMPDGKVSGKWECMKCNGRSYLVRILRYRNIYMGGCANIDNLLAAIKNAGFVEPAYLTYYQNNGTELCNVLPDMENPLRISGEGARFKHSVENSDYLVISQPSQCGDYSLVALVREQSIIEGLGVLQKIIIILGFCVLLFMGLFTTAVRRWILRPVQKLEIDVYEEKMRHQKTQLSYQKAELQYMKLQVNPHFYINCLNIIHNLSIMNKNDLVRDMTTYLGNHLRYTMEGTTVDSLYKEVDYVENYLHIQELRFPGSLCAYVEIAPDVREVKVPPLILQTFVENTVKYQVVAGERTEIYIVVCRCDKPREDYISIEIWNSGEGFSGDVLEKLNDGQKLIDEKGEHYGIRNVISRLHLIYKGKEKITFDNHWETGGAYIIMELPAQIGEEVGT